MNFCLCVSGHGRKSMWGEIGEFAILSTQVIFRKEKNLKRISFLYHDA